MPVILLALLASFGFIHCHPILYGTSVANIREFPFIVRIKILTLEKEPDSDELNYYRTFCGGTIISRKSILTAAHCLENGITTPQVTVYAGAVHINDFGTEGQKIQMENFVSHPQYTLHNIDIAIIYLENLLILRNKMVAVASFSTANVGSKVTIAGWGQTELHARSDILKKAVMKVVTATKCLSSYENNNNFICILDFAKRKTFGNGDSGSPVIYKNSVVGIIMENNEKEIVDADGNKLSVSDAAEPGTCVNVTANFEWINSNTKKF